MAEIMFNTKKFVSKKSPLVPNFLQILKKKAGKSFDFYATFHLS